MLGELIARLDHPSVTDGVLATLDPELILEIQQRASAARIDVAGFTAGAVREFVDRADDDLWFQLLTVIRKADDPGLAAVQTILRWVATAP